MALARATKRFAVAGKARSLFADGGNDFLVRVKRGKFKSKVLRRCRDGSVHLGGCKAG